MLEKVTLELTQDYVSVKRQRYIEENGQRLDVGLPNRAAFMNSERGRTDLAAYLAEPYLSAVMAVWGANPTITEEIKGV